MKVNRLLIIIAFLSVPIAASFMSTLHLIDLFKLGNPGWMAVFLAITFEIGSIASFIALSVMRKIKKWIVLSIFFILFLEQLFGNVYSTFDYINQMLVIHPTWLASFTELIKPVFTPDDPNTFKFILALVIGAFIPLISLAFLKSMVDYLEPDEKQLEAKVDTLAEVISSVEDEAKKIDKKGSVAPYTPHSIGG